MIYTSQDAVIGVIGSIGVIAAAIVLIYSFGRNQMGTGRYDK